MHRKCSMKCVYVKCSEIDEMEKQEYPGKTLLEYAVKITKLTQI